MKQEYEENRVFDLTKRGTYNIATYIDGHAHANYEKKTFKTQNIQIKR